MRRCQSTEGVDRRSVADCHRAHPKGKSVYHGPFTNTMESAITYWTGTGLIQSIPEDRRTAIACWNWARGFRLQGDFDWIEDDHSVRVFQLSELGWPTNGLAKCNAI